MKIVTLVVKTENEVDALYLEKHLPRYAAELAEDFEYEIDIKVSLKDSAELTKEPSL